MDGWVARDAEGGPFDSERIPGRARSPGRTPEPVLMRDRQTSTGEGALDGRQVLAGGRRRGGRRIAVNVIEEVTEARRAERSSASSRRPARCSPRRSTPT